MENDTNLEMFFKELGLSQSKESDFSIENLRFDFSRWTDLTCNPGLSWLLGLVKEKVILSYITKSVIISNHSFSSVDLEMLIEEANEAKKGLKFIFEFCEISLDKSLHKNHFHNNSRFEFLNCKSKLFEASAKPELDPHINVSKNNHTHYKLRRSHSWHYQSYYDLLWIRQNDSTTKHKNITNFFPIVDIEKNKVPERNKVPEINKVPKRNGVPKRNNGNATNIIF